MTATFTPIGKDTLSALHAGDECALERIFREHYDVLLLKAGERLEGDRAAAPRLVEAVIQQLWQERDSITEPRAIEGFFNDAIREGAMRIRRQLASVHRLEHHEGVAPVAHSAPLSADRAWADIHESIMRVSRDPEEVARERSAHGAHEAAMHIASIAKPTPWRAIILGGTAIVLVAAAGLWWVDQASRGAAIDSLLASEQVRITNTGRGQLGTLNLADGSAVKLGPDTKLTVIPRFGKEYRALMVEGTAVLTVAPGNEIPFEARLGDIAVIAKGTVFAVRDFVGEPIRSVMVREGEVAVRGPNGEQIVRAGETLRITRTGEMRMATGQEGLEAFAWVDGRLVLNAVTLRETLRAMQRWYATELMVKDTLLLEKLVTLEAPLESSRAAIEGIESSAGVVFGWEGVQMVLTAPAAKKK